MVAHFGIDQGTEEWFKMKWGKIGGSLSKGLFVDTDTLLLQMIVEHTEDIDLDYDSYTSQDMQRGNELEPLGRSRLSEYLGVSLLNCGWLECEENTLLGISPDGITADFKVSAEIKCPAGKRHISTCRENEIPKDNIHQCVHYFTVNPHLERHYFMSFRPESIKPMFVKELTRSSLVDLGFTKKGKIKEDRGLGVKEYVSTEPDLRTVAEWVAISKANATKLKENITKEIELLKF